MKFEKVEEVVRKKELGRTTLRNLLEEFLKSGIKAAVVKDYEEFYSKPTSLRSALDEEIKKGYAGKINSSVIDGKVYVERLTDGK